MTLKEVLKDKMWLGTEVKSPMKNKRKASIEVNSAPLDESSYWNTSEKKKPKKCTKKYSKIRKMRHSGSQATFASKINHMFLTSKMKSSKLEVSYDILLNDCTEVFIIHYQKVSNSSIIDKLYTSEANTTTSTPLKSMQTTHSKSNSKRRYMLVPYDFRQVSKYGIA